MLRSSAFVALYVALCFAGLCALSNVTGKVTRPQLLAGATLAGLAVLVEKPSRRSELAMYCTAQVGWGAGR